MNEPKFKEGQEVTVVDTTVFAVGNHNTLYFTVEPKHVGTVLNPRMHKLTARFMDPTVLVQFELTGIGPMLTHLVVQLLEENLAPVDAETLEEAVEKLHEQ